MRVGDLGSVSLGPVSALGDGVRRWLRRGCLLVGSSHGCEQSAAAVPPELARRFECTKRVRFVCAGGRVGGGGRWKEGASAILVTASGLRISVTVSRLWVHLASSPPHSKQGEGGGTSSSSSSSSAVASSGSEDTLGAAAAAAVALVATATPSAALQAVCSAGGDASGAGSSGRESPTFLSRTEAGFGSGEGSRKERKARSTSLCHQELGENASATLLLELLGKPEYVERGKAVLWDGGVNWMLLEPEGGK